MAQETLKEDLKAEIAAGRVVVVTGTGITSAATGGQCIDGFAVWGWPGLLEHGVWTLQHMHGLLNERTAKILTAQIESNDIDLMVSAGETISSRLRGKAPGIFHRWLKDSVGKLATIKPDIVKVLSRLGGIVATLNYDSILEKGLKRNAVTWRERDRMEDVLREKAKDAVIHLHGYYEDPDSIVLGLREYDRVVNDAHTQAVLRLFTLDRTLLFIGCRGTVSDPNFTQLIGWAKQALQNSTHRHFLLCRENELAAVRQDAADAPWLHPLAYGAAYDDLVPFLTSLVPTRPARAARGTERQLALGTDRLRYAEAMRKKYRAPKLESLDVTSSYYREVDLWRIFIWQKTRECQEYLPHVLELPKDHIRRLTETNQLDDAEHFELARPEVEVLRRRYAEQSSRDARELLDDPAYGHLVVLGDPGSGKSSLLQALVRRWVDAFEQGIHGHPVPILIELASFAKARGSGIRNFFDYCAESDLAPWRFERSELVQLLSSGQACLYFDGLDEIFDPVLRADTVQSIARLGYEYPHVRIIVTSRVIGYKRETLRDADFRHVMLQDLDDEQIRQFLENWHRDTHRPEEGSERDEKHSRLVQAISDSRAIRELAGNPLLLTMMAIVNRSQELPRDRAELYRQCAKLLLHQWKIEEALRADPVLREDRLAFDAEEKQNILRSVARHMQEGAQGLAGNVIAADALKRVIVDAVTGLVRSPAEQVAKALIHHLRERVYILCFLGADTYAFVHRTFLEFYCAEDLRLRFEKKKALRQSQILALFDKHSQDETWHEVFSLLCAMLDPAIVGKSVKRLLAIKEPERQSQAVFLAARCLTEVRRRNELADVIAAIHRRLEELTAWDHPFFYDPWEDEAQVTIQTRTKAVSALVATANDRGMVQALLKERAREDEFGAVRQACVQELARVWKTDPGTLPWLKERAREDESWAVRQACVQELARGWKTDPDTLPLLKERAREDESWAVRQACVQELARVWKTDPDTLPWLKERAREDEDEDVRQACVQELARVWKTDPDTLPWLKERARADKSGDVQKACVQELARVWMTDPDTLPWLRERAREDEDGDVRKACVQELARVWKTDPDTLPWLKERAREDESGAVRQACVQELARGWKTNPDTLPWLKEQAREDESWAVRLTCVQELARGWKTDPDTLPWLKERAHEDEDEDVRQACVQELARGWKTDPDTLPLLKERAHEDEFGAVRQACVQELVRGWKTDPDTLPLLKERAREYEFWAVRQTCVQELARGWKTDPDTLPLLKERAREDEVEAVRLACVQELARGWKTDPDTLPWLKERAREDEVEAVRLACVQELARGWKTDPDTLPLLKERAREDESWVVRQACVQELARGWKTDPDTLPLLKERARADESGAVRLACVQELVSRWKTDPDTLPLLKERAREDESWDVRKTYVQELVRGWKTDPDTLPWLKEQACEDKSGAVRQACVQELARGWTTSPDTLPWLKVRARDDENGAVRKACVQELARRWTTDRDTLPWLKVRARDDENGAVRKACVQELARAWKTDPDTLPLLKERAREDESGDVRQACVQELARGWKTDPDTLPLLKERAREDEFGAVRQACVQELARVWKTDPNTLPLLKERAREDENEAVRKACVQELARAWKTDPDTLPLLKERAVTDEDPVMRQVCVAALKHRWIHLAEVREFLDEINSRQAEE